MKSLTVIQQSLEKEVKSESEGEDEENKVIICENFQAKVDFISLPGYILRADSGHWLKWASVIWEKITREFRYESRNRCFL